MVGLDGKSLIPVDYCKDDFSEVSILSQLYCRNRSYDSSTAIDSEANTASRCEAYRPFVLRT